VFITRRIWGAVDHDIAFIAKTIMHNKNNEFFISFPFCRYQRAELVALFSFFPLNG